MTNRTIPSIPAPALCNPSPSRGAQARVDLNATGMATTYTNLFRVTGTYEELIVDFGLHSGLITPSGPEAVKISHRMVMSFPTAKRLLAALQLALAAVMNKSSETWRSIHSDEPKNDGLTAILHVAFLFSPRYSRIIDDGTDLVGWNGTIPFHAICLS